MTITVLGGGIVGRSVALALARQGERVALIDGGNSPAAASWGNAGHIAIEQVAPLASIATVRSIPHRLFARGGALDLPIGQVATWLPFSLRLLGAARPSRFAHGSKVLGGLLGQAMPAWRRLADAIGAPGLVREDGHFIGWETPATARAGRAAWRAADTGTATVGDAGAVEAARLRTLAPGLSDLVQVAGSGQIADLDLLATTLDAALQAAGVRRITQLATLRRDGGRVAIDGIPSDRIVVAAGIGSRAPMMAAGHAVPLIAERGYHIRAAADRWPADLPPVVFEDRSIIVTRYRDCVQVAGFVELGRADAPPDPRKWDRLEAHVAALGLPIAGPFVRWMGARPTLPDYLPAIGRSTRADNLFYAFGHQHLGLTLAPITAELIAAAIAGRPPALDLSPFAIERF
jgi:D-amino-acid dehydrogenase